MARLLIVGGGYRGLLLAEGAAREGHAVRIVTREETRREPIEAAGAECWIGDPNRLGTLLGALEGVAVVCWLLGDATGSRKQLRELHSSRLRALLAATIDSTVRGFIYEAAGSAALADALAEGERVAREVTGRNSIPLALLRVSPADLPNWLVQARRALSFLLAADRGALAAFPELRSNPRAPCEIRRQA